MKTLEGKTQKQIFDLASFEEVLLVKKFPYPQIENAEEALTYLTNEESKVLAVINAGLKAMAAKEAYDTDSNWRTLMDDGKTFNGEFTGQPANVKIVNGMVLTLAKSVYKFNKDMTKEQKSAAKDKARNFIKNNEELRAGLTETAMAAPIEDDDEDDVKESETAK